MATSDYWSSADLKGVPFKGLINEDVMQRIWDISRIPLPLTDMIGSGAVVNSYHEWTTDKLAAVNTANAAIDGQDFASTVNNAQGGARVGNHCQISTKIVRVSSRANKSDTIGRNQELAYQLMMRQQELKRDIEAIMLTQQASVGDDGNTTAGKSAGLGAWLTTNTFRGATGADGGFSGGVVAAPTPGTPRALSETLIRDCAQSVYEQGGNPSVLMGTVTVIRKLSEYMFTASARIATLTSETGQNPGSKVAQGSVNVFVTDFGVVLEMVANRLQQPIAAGVSTLFMIDPAYLEIGYMTNVVTDPLAKNGLNENRLMHADWTLKVLNESAHGLIADIDEALAVVA